MKILNKYFIPILLLILAIGTSFTSNAQSTMEIRIMNDQHPHMYIDFNARNNNPADLDAIRLYEAEGHTNNISDFKLIREYDLTNYPNIDSVTWNSQTQRILTRKANNFPYEQNMSYFMTAVIGNNESNPPDSMYYTYFNEPIDSLYFTVNPPSLTIAEVGEQFLYNPSAHTSGIKKISYKLIDPPNTDASINKNTGLLTYNATQVGDFSFTIRAYLETEPSNYIEQEMRIRVLKCKTNIKGNLTSKNQALEKLIRVSVDIFKVEKDSSIYYSSVALVNNSFTATVDEGKYQVRLNGYSQNESIKLWYDNTKYIDDAEILETTCGNDISFDWEVDLTAFEKETITILPIISGTDFKIVNKGETFEKEIEYTTTPAGGEVEFSLTYNKNFILTGPDNNILKLDTQEPGYHQVVVNASLKNNPSIRASQLVSIWRNECENLTNLKVNLKDKETGELYKKTVTAGIYLAQTINDSTSIIRSLASDTITDGLLEFNLPKGEYMLEIGISTYHNNNMLYYQYKYKADKPIVGPNDKFEFIEVDCDDMTLDWEIIPPVPVYDYTISGTVTDEDSGDELGGILVELLGKNKLTNAFKSYKTTTYNDGSYSFKVPNDSEYEISAVSIDSMTNANYLREYWEETANPLEATLLDLESNLTNINFTLNERDEYKNSLTGKILDEDDKGVKNCVAVAYLVETNSFDKDFLYYSETAYTNSKGEFTFEDLIPGDYVVYAYKYDRGHTPGYYVSDDKTLTRSWLDATRIEVEETGIFGDIELRLAPLKPIASNKGLNGKVGRLKGISPGSTEVLSPLNGVQVFVTNTEDNVINYNYSLKDGEYEVPNLENGELNVYFDKVGFKMAHEQIVISDNNENIELDVELEGLSTSDVTPFEEVSASVYPNPSTGNVTITGDFKLGSYIVKVISVTGNTVKIIPMEVTDPNFNLDLSDLYSGQYYIHLIGNNANYSTKLNIVK